MNFNEMLETRTREVEAVVERYLPAADGYQKTVLDAMNYSVRAGGKRLRPMLMEETYRLFGGSGTVVEPFMAAIEMIHTSSLIHDDLPCMDNDELRRGLPTTWVKYGYDMAVLAGDSLLIYAVETAAKAFALTEDAAVVGRCIGILAQKTGIYGMIGGQTVDVELTNKPVPHEKLDFIYHLKTGALLESSMMIGALLAGADEEETRLVEQMAAAIGLAFQIQDDILDVTSSMEVLGKPVLSDEKNNKTTYVTLEGLEKAKQDVASISDDAVRILHELPGENEFLEALIHMLVSREK
ncbi:polyprenyl synthetase family protein [Hungatella hathewayi]|uniref:Farnesyl diphosphate synthase n=2 Tax=Hungatella hathewayi TaxID=154046 RepID=D3ACX1_9FIRM|nr:MULTISPECIES: farnesyl diphosphate synthase [Hungatella]EFD00338.1 polyprenyl synthetase [Hungatella hathewayi DSM 13479]MBS6754714.1 polyprenyl synthetase family protein [Hungatella hathewayi]MBT9795080.1 polyprenyl synthetase family protein [Hungatella hathewayi]MCI6455980.1 polyprenyl synthetase family protein [Hungatella sp.]RGZ00261.1 polyprenyl synthetase family protein [Hungatella hathewayi]